MIRATRALYDTIDVLRNCYESATTHYLQRARGLLVLAAVNLSFSNMEMSFEQSDTTIEKLDETSPLHTPPNYVSQRNRPEKGSDWTKEFCAFREEMRNLLTSLISPQKDDIGKIFTALVEIKTTNSEIDMSLVALTAQNEELRCKLEKLEIQAKKDRDCITALEDRLEDLQRGSRKGNLEIKNVPKQTLETKEDLIKMTVSLSKSIDCKIEKNDINDIYRVQNKRSSTNNNGPIVIELSSTIVKTEFLRKAKTFNIKHKEKLCAKHLGLKKDEYVPIYVSEQLTAKAARLFYLARDVAKSTEYKFCWTAYGRVYIRKDENSPIIQLRSEAQVQSLMQNK